MPSVVPPIEEDLAAVLKDKLRLSWQQFSVWLKGVR